MIALYEFEFCHVEVYEDYVITVMKEGIIVTPEFITQMSFIAEKHFKNKVFVYISHRVNSYALNPTLYFEVNKLDNLIALAIVSKDPKQWNQSKIERTFVDRDLEQFDTLEEALEWKDKIIKKHIKK